MIKYNKIKTIAEIGINANGSIDIAKQLIKWAAISGFDYVKFQKRNPDKCVPEAEKNKIKSTPWGEMTYIEYKKKIEFERKEYDEIDKYCKLNNIGWFASAWDLDSAEFLKDYCDIIKIPSALVTDDTLIKYCKNNFDKIIISTGMSTEEEINKAIVICEPDVIMHCCAAYPAKSEDLNLNYITHLKEKYKNSIIGYSGHEEGLTTTFAAAAFGIEWIERHITLDHTMWGSDQRASLEPIGMIKLIKGIREIEKALGTDEDRIILDCELSKRESLKK